MIKNMNSKDRSNIIMALIASLTLGLAPFTPEPHLFGKLRWIAGGGEGMTMQDYGDLLMHGLPWLLLIYFVGKALLSNMSGDHQEQLSQMKALITDKNTHIIDVRESSEFNAGHIPNAIHIPLSQIGNKLDKVKKLNGPKVLYCRSGNRSGQALTFLTKKGVKDLFNGGGMSDMKTLLNK